MTERPPVLAPAYPASARSSILAANALYLMMGASLVLLYLFAPQLAKLFRALFGEITQAQFQLGVSALIYPLFCLIPVVIVMAKRGGAALRLSGVGFGVTLLSFFMGLACVFLSLPVSALWMMLLDALHVPVLRATVTIANESDLLVGVFAIAIAPGIFEELLFRGPILSAYERGGTKRALLISSLLFAMLHGTIAGLPIQFIMGMVLGYAVICTNSVYAGMMIHTTYNAANVLISYAARGAATEAASGGVDALYENMEVLSLLAGLVVNGIIALGVVMLFIGFFKRHREREGFALFPAAPLRLGASEAIVLLSGIVTALFLYADNMFDILGYLS